MQFAGFRRRVVCGWAAWLQRPAVARLIDAGLNDVERLLVGDAGHGARSLICGFAAVFVGDHDESSRRGSRSWDGRRQSPGTAIAPMVRQRGCIRNGTQCRHRSHCDLHHEVGSEGFQALLDIEGGVRKGIA